MFTVISLDIHKLCDVTPNVIQEVSVTACVTLHSDAVIQWLLGGGYRNTSWSDHDGGNIVTASDRCHTYCRVRNLLISVRTYPIYGTLAHTHTHTHTRTQAQTHIRTRTHIMRLRTKIRYSGFSPLMSHPHSAIAISDHLSQYVFTPWQHTHTHIHTQRTMSYLSVSRCAVWAVCLACAGSGMTSHCSVYPGLGMPPGRRECSRSQLVPR